MEPFDFIHCLRHNTWMNFTEPAHLQGDVTSDVVKIFVILSKQIRHW